MSRRAFSLAEMMIALAVLAMGLLVIGAALPIGVSYTQQSMNISVGQDAVEYALDVIEQNVCLYDHVLPQPGHLQYGSGVQTSEPGLFQPRLPASDPSSPGKFVQNYEPIIKVRPLYLQGVFSTPGASYGTENVALAEEAVRSSLALMGFGGVDTRECDYFAPGVPPRHWMQAALASACTVYPPISPDTEWTIIEFFNAPYDARRLRSPGGNPSGAETIKVLERRLAWAAFYRRVSYAPGSDPSLYEFIVVAVRRPTERHRFPVQAANDGGQQADGAGRDFSGSSSSSSNSSGSVAGASGLDFSAPVPWLVSFTSLPSPPGGFDPNTGVPWDINSRPIVLGQAPATLAFTCDVERSGLFPVGAIFIPARNDVTPNLVTGTFYGLGPPSSSVLPIYEVVERPDATTVLVKYNGHYPMQGPPPSAIPNAQAQRWPVWVIPPAYEEKTANGDPIMPGECPIVAVGRRYIHLHRVP